MEQWLEGSGQPWEVLEQERSRTYQGLVAENRTDCGWEISLPGRLCLRLLVLLYEAEVGKTRHSTPEGSPVPTVCIPELAGPRHSQALRLSTILKREAWRSLGGNWEDGERMLDSTSSI